MTGVRVMTWNVCGQPEDFGNPESGWEKRGKLIARIIRRYAPDVIGLQEPQRLHFEWLRDALGEYGAPHRVFQEHGFKDAWLEAGNADGRVSTLHGNEGERYDARDPRFGGPDADPYWRVDWILVRDGRRRIRIEDCFVIRDWEPPLYPSDHYPVVADLAFSED